MPTGNIALVKEQGVSFAVVSVRDSVIDNPVEREDVLRFWSVRTGLPTALLGAHRHRSYGRRDIVGWLETVHPSRLPWRRINM